MYDALTIARYIINYSNYQGYGVTNLKLQKLLYFVQAAFLKIYGDVCFKEDMQAWMFGPVIPNVYHQYKRYGNREIPGEEIMWDDPSIQVDHKETIKFIIDFFKDYSSSSLVQITHEQAPWKNAYVKGENRIIKVEDLKEVFS